MPISEEELCRYMRAYIESADEENRVRATFYVGTRSEVIATVSCTRGNTNELRQDYERLRDICLMSNQPNWKQSEIGPIEDKFFFLSDDKLPLDPPVLRDTQRSPRVLGNAIRDEWNLFGLLQTFGQEDLRRTLQEPFYREALELWKRRSIPYSETIAKVATMVIVPKLVS